MATKLKPEVAAKYKLVGIEVAAHHFAGLGVIDLAELPIEMADRLHRNGFKFLVPKKTKPKAGKQSP